MAKSNNNQKKLVGQSEFGEEVWELIDRLITWIPEIHHYET